MRELRLTHSTSARDRHSPLRPRPLHPALALVRTLAFAAQPFVIVRERFVGRRHVEVRVARVAGIGLAAGAQRIGGHLAKRLRSAGRHARAVQS